MACPSELPISDFVPRAHPHGRHAQNDRVHITPHRNQSRCYGSRGVKELRLEINFAYVDQALESW